MTVTMTVTPNLSQRLVSDQLWAWVGPVLPPAKVRPQGGGRPRTDDRAVFTAVVFVLTSDCAWRGLPQFFGVSAPTAHRRFTEWTNSDVWCALEDAAANLVGQQEEIAWLNEVVAAAKRRSG